jgi:protein O-mannosyl-transferase
VQPANPAQFVSSAKARVMLFSFLLAVAAYIPYSSVIHNSFVNFDDDEYLAHTPQIHEKLDWHLLRWAFTTYAQGNWHPLTWLSHALDYQLFGLEPAAVHVENMFLHIASCVLLFLLLERTSKSVWRSATLAALFAIHPLNVESVAWAAERKNVLSMFFCMVALWAYGRYTEQRTVPRYLLVFGAFAAGLMAKPQIVTFPFVLLLWDSWPLGRWPIEKDPKSNMSSLGRLIQEKIPLFVLSLASSIVTVRAQMAGGTIGDLVSTPLSLRLQNVTVAYARYLGKAIWPFHLALLYPYPTNGLPVWQSVGAALLLLAISALVFVERQRRYLVIGWLWFLGTLVPMIGVVQVGVAAMADRYAYLPLIGLLMMVTWGLADWAQAHAIGSKWLATATVAALILFGWLTYRQVGYWHDSEALWRHTLEVTGDNYTAEVNLGGELLRTGQEEEASMHFRRAIEIHPEDMIALLYLGAYEGRHGDYADAAEHIAASLHYMTDSTDPAWKDFAYTNLGTAYRNLHDYDRARENFLTALQINPSNQAAIMGLGLIASQ